MAQKGIREFDAKRMLARFLPEYTSSVKYDGKIALVTPTTDFNQLAKDYTWLNSGKLVVKPDQLFGKRGKNNLLLIGADYKGAQKWINERMNKEVTIKQTTGTTTGVLTHFMIEPMVEHKDEYYVAIKSSRAGDTIYFSLQGGINVEENWDKVKELTVPVLESIDSQNLNHLVPSDLGSQKEAVIDFIKGLFKVYQKLNFSYLEINPFTVVQNNVVPLDTVAKLDDTGAFESSKDWGEIDFPPSFGMKTRPEEQVIKELDEKSGSSLKLTIINPEGRIWLMVAGGGASVIYADTVVDLGQMKELANYGEYSGNPTTDETQVYAETILEMMTRTKHPQGKALLIGGGIANFTDVAKTFTGINNVLRKYQAKLRDHNIKIYVRRGGPNYLEGLEKIKKLGEELNISIEVYGPETHMTKIVPLAVKALGLN